MHLRKINCTSRKQKQWSNKEKKKSGNIKSVCCLFYQEIGIEFMCRFFFFVVKDNG